MNKQKFETKCQALYAYEDEMLAKMKEFVKPLNDELNNYDYKVECHLMWFYNDEIEENKRFSLNRRNILYKRPYICRMHVILCHLCCSFLDENEDDKRGMMYIDGLTAYGLTLLRGWAFSRWKCRRIIKSIEKIIEDKNRHGIGYIIKKYNLD